MPYFTIEVTEKVSRPCLYTIEAEDHVEAKEKAIAGETVFEEQIEEGEVLARHVDTSTLEEHADWQTPEPEHQTLFTLVREERNGRCVLGLYSTREKAKAAAARDATGLRGKYHVGDDYSILERVVDA